MVRKVERKIVAISRAFLVSLPVEFVREHRLSKGSVVRLYYNGDIVIEAGSAGIAKTVKQEGDGDARERE